MRLSLANAFLVGFLCQALVRTDGQPPNGVRSALEEWEELLRRFRAPGAEGRRSGRGSLAEEEDFLQDEEEVGVGAGGSPLGEEAVGSLEDSEGDSPIRGASLAFVFDSTGSMHDELNQVKVGASKILRALRDHPDAPIYNYIWVPFSDPGVGPVTVTRDDKEFQERVQDVVVGGGGDCPEMSVGAIKKALEASLPNSYIYVFTDASAKDHRLQNEVVSLVQRKKSQVVFILTGNCSDFEEPNYKVYERIAESSSGQIYTLSRNEVKEVLEYVNVAIQPHVVSLLSLNKPAPARTNPDKLQVLVDGSLNQFTVSVSGVNASINVTDPRGAHIHGPPKLENVLNLTNIKVVNVKQPDPGSWSLFINSDSNYTVRSTGLSKIKFSHGFSTAETVNLKETNYRPLKGAESFILIQTSDSEKVFNITDVDFVGLGGEVLLHVDLSPVPEMPGLYKGGSFVPPSEFFYLGVTGFGEDGLPVKRITATAVSPQLPEKPIISMKSSAVGRAGRPGAVKCYVESVVPFSVRWYKDGGFVGEEKNCSETCEVVLRIEELNSESEGTYSCRAKNVAGVDSKSVALTVIGEAPSVVVRSPVVVSLGDTVFLDCTVESEIPVAVKWTQFTARNKHSGVLHPVSRGTRLANHTLRIEAVKAEDEGWYVCNAVNRGGESRGRVLLVVKEPLLVEVEPSAVTYVEGDSARLTCSASGKPQPRLEWIRDQQPIKNNEEPSVVVEEVNGKLHLVVDYLEKKNAGTYLCNAMNSEESATAAVELVYTERPVVKAKENNVMVKAGSEVVLRCSASGHPQPKMKWYKEEKEIEEEERFEVEENALRIRSTLSSDAGEYSCVAQNNLGSDADYIGLIVGSPPSFLHKPKDKKIQIAHNGTIPCSATGVPPPEVKWWRADGRALEPGRMVTLSSGALRVVRAEVEDAGRYVCRAENVFGAVSSEASIVVTGTERPVGDASVELRKVEASSGGELRVPCGMVLGSPRGEVKWLKDGVEVVEDEGRFVEESGTLVIRNATTADRGSYVCRAQNAVGSSSRAFEVLIHESPKIKGSESKGLKAKVGGEIEIPCPVEGFPVPTVTWTRNGEPLPMSSTIFQDEEGSLIIRDLSEESGGVYICTAINAAGSASKATSVHVQVPPAFPDDVQDSSVNVVEGHVVVLNCNVTAVPEPTIRWFKNEEPLLQDSDQPKTLRFVASVDDTGTFKCLVENEAGSSAKEFNVTILVPPKILGRKSEESIKARAGTRMTLLCDVFGVPTPTILWQRNGMYLTQNTSEVEISGTGTLVIHNVTKESAGAYTCDAENLGGITQRMYYLQVNYPPSIMKRNNESKVITLKEGENYSLSCLVEGHPKPNVLWKKNGLPVLGQQHDLVILEDNTLVFLQVSRETTGLYRCEAVSSEGSTHIEHEVKVLIPPSLSSESFPTALDVNEGDSLSLTCPVAASDPPSHIQWFKDGDPLVLLQERSDEAQMKLSVDQRTLTIIEAHPSDGGNFSCSAVNPAGRTDARFLVDVLMTPHFEEFNHVAHRTILTGGEVVLNCSVSGNPQPKVSWRKESTPVTPHHTPGVQVSLDKQHLVIVNGKVHHSGTYICVATNKVSTKEREFYVRVLEPPQISGRLQEEVDVLQGANVTLECDGSGVPPPSVTWTKEDSPRKTFNSSEKLLRLWKVTCDDSGVYLCDVSNEAGRRTKHFQVNVLQKPQIEDQERIEELSGVLGGNVTLKCKATGVPKPEIAWLHNGHILSRARRFVRAADSTDDSAHASLLLTNLQQRDQGMYTLLASNRAGVGQKRFHVRILVPPRLPDGHPETTLVDAIHPFPVVLKCPAYGEPPPAVGWFFGGTDGEVLRANGSVQVEGPELRVRGPSGVYSCLAENAAGRVAHSFNVTVVEPPKIEGNLSETVIVFTNNTITLHCNSTRDEHSKHFWFRSARPLTNSSNSVLLDSNRTLVLPKAHPTDAGVYTCLVMNAAGSAEVSYSVHVHEPPFPSDGSFAPQQKVVQLHRPFSLHCSFGGHPPPEVTWMKDGRVIEAESSRESMLLENAYLAFSRSRAEDAGEYRCLAENSAGRAEKSFRVEVVVRGEWRQWSAWSECSVSCGFGEQRRHRSCSVAIAEAGVKVDKSRCRGSELEERKCHRECQVGWTSWGSWSGCSSACGGGVRGRYRVCRRPTGDCEGEEAEEEVCGGGECSVDGQWSEWSEWSECSDSCGGGVMQRVRRCDSPAPLRGGEDCRGWGTELKTCNRHKCPSKRTARLPEKWSAWSEWSPCSASCRSRRTRVCRSSKGSVCKGENLEMRRCSFEECGNPLPRGAEVRVRGVVNGRPLKNRVDVHIESLESEGLVSANMSELSGQKKELLPFAPLILSPLCWNAAYETDNADNGFSLTEGNFFSESDIKFDSGEELRMKHRGEGVDGNGTLVVEIEVVGEVPVGSQRSVVLVGGGEQEVVQTGRSRLHSRSRGNVSVGGREVEYSWRSSVSYDEERGRMPYLVERLKVRGVRSEDGRFIASSEIGRKFAEDKCPPGFLQHRTYNHCEDIDECEMEEELCQKEALCQNTFGSYKCLCKNGFRQTDHGCQDLNECALNIHLCSHLCHNTLGSYTCSCPPGFLLAPDRRTCSRVFPPPHDTSRLQPSTATQDVLCFRECCRPKADSTGRNTE